MYFIFYCYCCYCKVIVTIITVLYPFIGFKFPFTKYAWIKNVPLEELAGVSCAALTSYCDVFSVYQEMSISI